MTTALIPTFADEHPNKDFTRHPCFNKNATGQCGRVHLPVAPKCNIQCNFCNRKYDCVLESRPGVTSTVLKPHEAVTYMDKVLEKEPRITVVGIAGPGDPFANPEETITTMRLLNEKYPHLLFCLSTNGLGLPPYLDELKGIGVSHVTVTVTGIDPMITQKIYSFVLDGNKRLEGREAAELLLARQMESIKGLKERGMVVKVNTIVIPGVNDDHVPVIAAKMREMGVDMHNLIPVKPVEGTPFAECEEPTKEMMKTLREESGKHVPQMTHCRRCRADAVGLLGEDRSKEMFGCLQESKETSCGGPKHSEGAGESLRPLSFTSTEKVAPDTADKPYVAVATREGLLINQHLGEAPTFQIWQKANGSFSMVEERTAPPKGGGSKRWEAMAELFKDCRAVLASHMGDTPRILLEEHGIVAAPVEGFINDALNVVYDGGDLAKLAGKSGGGSCKTAGCTGGGEGC